MLVQPTQPGRIFNHVKKKRQCTSKEEAKHLSLYGENGLVYSDADKAEILADSLKLQCTPTYENIDVDHKVLQHDKFRHVRGSLEHYDKRERC